MDRAKAVARLDGGTLRGHVISAIEREIAIREQVQSELDSLESSRSDEGGRLPSIKARIGHVPESKRD